MSRNDNMVGYEAACRACDCKVTYANMYGMFTCPDCGYHNNPAFPDAEDKQNEGWDRNRAIEIRNRRSGAKIVQGVTVQATATPITDWAGRWDEKPS